MLSKDDLAFLDRRRRFAFTWNAVAAVLLLSLAGALTWLVLSAPGLIDPAEMVRVLGAGIKAQSPAETAVFLLPIAVLGCFVIGAVLIVYGVAVFANERRYLRIIDRLITSSRERAAAATQRVRAARRAARSRR